MHPSKPANGKSKRAQLLAKKKQKGKVQPRVVDLEQEINLISEDELSFNNSQETPQIPTKTATHQNIDQEQSPAQGYEPKPTSKYNSFNYSRLTKAPLLQMALQSPKASRVQIQIVEDERPLNSASEQAYRSYTFSVEGQKDQKKVRDTFLKDLASKQAKAVDKPPREQPDSKEKANESKEKLNESKEKLNESKEKLNELKDKANESKEKTSEAREQFEKKSRYFEISHQICYKCNKEGHYAKNCIQVDCRKCKICFSRLHDEHSCPQICFECGEPGHISSQCTQSREKCERCRQRGHSSNYCGVILRDKERITNLETCFSEADLKRMKCVNEERHERHQAGKKEPHYNCFVYKDWPMPYHEFRKNQSKYGKANQPRQDYRVTEPRSRYSIDQDGYLISRNFYQGNYGANEVRNGYQESRNGYQESRNGYQESRNGYQESRNGYHGGRNAFYEGRNSERWDNGRDHRIQRSDSRVHSQDHRNNGSQSWRNDQFERHSRALEERERGRGKWERRQFRSDTYY